ncbi:hypothetical protein PF002_g32308, partial [Phytophthora fragariae]
LVRRVLGLFVAAAEQCC